MPREKKTRSCARRAASDPDAMTIRTQVACDGHGCRESAAIVLHLPPRWHRVEVKRTIYAEDGQQFTTHTVEHYCPACVGNT